MHAAMSSEIRQQCANGHKEFQFSRKLLPSFRDLGFQRINRFRICVAVQPVIQ